MTSASDEMSNCWNNTLDVTHRTLYGDDYYVTRLWSSSTSPLKARATIPGYTTHDAHFINGMGVVSGRDSSNLHGFENGSDALSATDTHGDQRIPATRAPQLVERLDRQNAARC